MVQESVWFEQVGAALLSHFNTLFAHVLLSDGTEIAIPIVLRKPEEDLKDEAFPMITIYGYNVRFDTIRYGKEKVVVNADPTTGKAKLESQAKPYTLYYQVDFWSKYAIEMHAMTMEWLSSFDDKSFLLPVVDTSGVSRICRVFVDPSLGNADMIQGSERLFRSIINLRIWVELDPRIGEDIQLIKSIEAQANNL